MIPAGYMAKHVATRPDWLKADCVVDIYSVSHCVSDDFADYINYWQHNGYWLFDAPETIREIAKDNSFDLSNTRLFYYEVHEFEYDENESSWKAFGPESSFKTQIVQPETKHLEGYEVVTFFVHTSPECSPLSCNSLASEIETNEHCLLPSYEKAKQLLEEGKFDNTEPGPYRIFAVYSVEMALAPVVGCACFLFGLRGTIQHLYGRSRSRRSGACECGTCWEKESCARKKIGKVV